MSGHARGRRVWSDVLSASPSSTPSTPSPGQLDTTPLGPPQKHQPHQRRRLSLAEFINAAVNDQATDEQGTHPAIRTGSLRPHPLSLGPLFDPAVLILSM